MSAEATEPAHAMGNGHALEQPADEVIVLPVDRRRDPLGHLMGKGEGATA